MDVNEYREQVKHPGKFEGEQAYVPYFYDQSLDGCFEDIYFSEDETISYSEITTEDAEVFPELLEHVGQFFAFYVSTQGFVYGSIVDQAQIDAWEEQASKESEEDVNSDNEEYTEVPKWLA